MKIIEWLDELWRYRELFYFLVWRDIKVRYKQTLLGVIWVVIQPFASMIVFTVFFGKLAKMPSEGVPYAIFSYAALVPWTYFSSAVGRSGNSLIHNMNLITKVYFPRIALVVSSTMSGLIDYGVSFVVLLGLMQYFDIQIGWKILLVPLLTIVLVMLSLGIGMILSSLNVKYRDIGHIIPFMMQLLLFVSPIIYPISMIPERYRGLASLNPLCGIINGFRSAILPSHQVNWQELSISLAIALLLLVIGLIYFRNTERDFADII